MDDVLPQAVLHDLLPTICAVVGEEIMVQLLPTTLTLATTRDYDVVISVSDDVVSVRCGDDDNPYRVSLSDPGSIAGIKAAVLMHLYQYYYERYAHFRDKADGFRQIADKLRDAALKADATEGN